MARAESKTTKPARAAQAKPDPIFAAIEAHKRAFATFQAVVREDTPLSKKYGGKAGAKTGSAEATAAWKDHDRRWNAANRVEQRALSKLCKTAPGTPEGSRALVAYVAAMRECDSELIQSHQLYDLIATLGRTGNKSLPESCRPPRRTKKGDIRRRLEMIQKVAATTGHCIITDAEIKKAMNRRTSIPMCDFCGRYGQSLDWVCMGDISGMIASRIVDAGASTRGTV
jgi:hypothetical protein